MDEDELSRALLRLEAFENARPSRRYLVAVDNAIAKLSELVRTTEAAAPDAGEFGAELAALVPDAVALLEGLKAERSRVAELLRKERN